MWEQDWALLGIEPTTELAAIKKAYALKLRITRPDDDAEAYQALRGAYERVQQWLKWQQEEVAEASNERVTEPSVEMPTAASPAPAESPLQPRIEPGPLVEELTLCWRHGGDATLLRHWATVHRQLDQQALSRQAEFSAAFAQWVLDTPALPDAFLRAVNTHFGWLEDFRTERQLGPALAHALHDALDARVRPLVLDPGLRALAAPLLGLDALRKTGGLWWRIQLLCFLLQPTLARGQHLLGEQRLLRLGLDTIAQDGLKEAALRGLWLRVGIATLACMVAGIAWAGDAFIGIGYGLSWLVGTVAVMLVGWFAGSMMLLPAALIPPLLKWRRHSPYQPALALVWLLFAAFLCYLAATPEASPNGGSLSLLPPWAYGYAAAGFAAAGLLVAWPDDMQHAGVAGGLAPLIGWLAVTALGAWLPASSCLLIGAAWMLAAAAVHEERLLLPESTPLRWLVRPMLNSLVLVDRWTYVVALTPLSVAVAWAVFSDGKVGALRIFLVWVLSILAVGWLQLKADAWCLRWLPAAQADEA